MDKTLNLQKLYFKDTSFVSLMKERIYNILLIASKYDAFMLEEDGRIDELIFNEYTALNLRYPPRFTIASENKEVKETKEVTEKEEIKEESSIFDNFLDKKKPELKKIEEEDDFEEDEEYEDITENNE